MGLDVVLIAVLLLIVAGGGAYFLVLVPRRWRIPLGLAQPLLDSTDRAGLEQADQLLAQAINAGPQGRVLNDARFAQAYVRARLGDFDADQYASAAAVLADLVAATGYDEATAFLDLWLRSKLGQHSRVCDLFEKEQALLGGSDEARTIASISFLKQAVASWRRREPQGAMRYFRRVRELDRLTAEIPEHVDDLELVEGIQALFDDRPADARRGFASARAHAAQERKPTARATLGLIVCDWRDGRRDAADAGVGVILEELELELIAEPGPEEERLRLNTAMFHVITLLHEWQRPEVAGVLPSREEFEQLDKRVGRVLTADPDNGDALLIAGLWRYYFSVRWPQIREVGVDLLERGLGAAKPIVHPEIRRMVEFERALGDRTTGRGLFIRWLDEVVRDGTVDPGRRRQLRAMRDEMEQRYARDRDLDGTAGDAEVIDHPSVRDILERFAQLRGDLAPILGPVLRDDPSQAGELNERLDRLDAASTRFKDSADEVQSSYAAVADLTGQLLISEEDPT